MAKWEAQLAKYQAVKRCLDIVRNIAILTVWIAIGYLLFSTNHWIWGIIWIPAGGILVLNVIGFAMLPLYKRAARKYATPIESVLDEIDEECRYREENGN